jgi:hypothetical protein
MGDRMSSTCPFPHVSLPTPARAIIVYFLEVACGNIRSMFNSSVFILTLFLSLPLSFFFLFFFGPQLKEKRGQGN